MIREILDEVSEQTSREYNNEWLLYEVMLHMQEDVSSRITKTHKIYCICTVHEQTTK